MPESVTDRPTKAHEYIFMLSKSARYYWDAEAVREENQAQSTPWGSQNNKKINDPAAQGAHGKNSAFGPKTHAEMLAYVSNGRNLRTVWTMATAPTPYAHFATFPPELPRRCIMAGTSERGCCAECGAPWRRVVEKGNRVQAHWEGTEQTKAKAAKGKHGATSVIETGSYQTYTTIGWEPTCKCGADTVPCTVLDHFAGSGTTLQVAKQLGRRSTGIELSEEYAAMCVKHRLQGQECLVW